MTLQPILRRVEAWEITCPYCGITWRSRTDKIPRVCAGCKKYWRLPKDEGNEEKEPTPSPEVDPNA